MPLAPRPMGATLLPRLPNSPVGGSAGPGGSPMLAPGGGAGSQAAAVAKIATLLEELKPAMMAFETQSKEFQACMRAITALNGIVGTKKADELTPAANQQTRAMGGRPSLLAGAQPPGMGGPPPPAPPPMPPSQGVM